MDGTIDQPKQDEEPALGNVVQDDVAATCHPGPRPRGWVAGAGPGASIVRGRIEGIADIEAIERVPPEQILPGRTAYECLQRAAALFPQKPALIALAGGGSTEAAKALNFSEYLQQATAAANLFHAAAGGARSVVAIMLPILPEALFATWGGIAAGVSMPVNPHLEPALIISILRSAKATVLVTTTAHGASGADRLGEIVAAVPSLRAVFLVDGGDAAPSLADAMAVHDHATLNFTPQQDAGGEALYLPTGGTTAAPKLTRLTNRGMVLNGWLCGAIGGAAEDDVVGIAMPIFHVGGMITLGLRAVVLAQTAVLLSPAGFRDRGVVGAFWSIVKALGVTTLVATPTTAAALYAQNGDDHAGHCLRTLNSGGSTVPVELNRNFFTRFGVELREVWGSTEFHGFLACQPNGPPPLIGSVGRRMPWHQVKAVILDDDNRVVREAAPGEQGVIIGSGPCVALGYVDAALDGGFLVTGMDDGKVWGSTGDLGRVDAEGFVWIEGRIKDIIIRGGHNIDPALIEEVLNARPEVLYAAAIGYPDREKGEMPIAYVEAAPGADIDTAALLAHCRATIAERAACPMAIHVLPQMPLTPVGKIFKPKLREMAIADAAAEVVRGIIDPPVEIIVDVTAKPRVTIRAPRLAPDDRTALSAALSGFAFETVFAEGNV